MTCSNVILKAGGAALDDARIFMRWISMARSLAGFSEFKEMMD
jgi:hypothetical protein